MKNDFFQESIDYMEHTDINHRKSLGQYFTPRWIREELIKLLPHNIKKPYVLDPACGTGEFLVTAESYFDKPNLEGWEIDKKLVDISKKLVPNANIKLVDSLKYLPEKRYDFIIGNPPYFEIKLEDNLKSEYGPIIGGRTNIFSLFVYHSLNLLKDGGYLAFVIPPSMNNGAYFSKLRQYIIKNADILSIRMLNSSSFHRAQQLTMIMVLKKTKNTGRYIFSFDGIQIFSENWKYLRESFVGKKSLRDLGFKVKTGRIVWNQHKDKLVDDKKYYPLIRSHNIGNDTKIILNNCASKKQYIKLLNPDVGPALVVNRITGASSSAKIRVAMIPRGYKFFAENHCNVVLPPLKKSKISLKDVMKQLNSKEKLKIFQSITGNTQISKNELEKLFPIDV